MSRLTISTLLALSMTLGVAACEGPPGADGADGADGQPGVDGEDGLDGEDGTDGEDGEDGEDGTDGEDGEDGEDADGFFPLEPAGVVGQVEDRAGDLVGGGTIYFVPADDVAALPATTIAVDSTNDEPLEDLIAASGGTYQKATVGADGRYVLPTLSSGNYYVTFVPDGADATHLPGGDHCRVATDASALIGKRLDIEVSSSPPDDAEYVGSGRCVTCHGRTGIADTMHRSGIWSPYEAGPLQNPAGRDELYEALDERFTEGTTVWFYGFDGSRGFDKYKTSESDPGSGVSFTVTAQMSEDGDFEMLLHNVANPADPDRVIRVDAIYGGGVKKQRYLTKVTNSSGTYYATMPLQYQHDGDESSVYGRTSKVWRDYHGDWYYDETAKKFKLPAAKSSFEKNCMSCHAVGTQITGSDETIWKASTITDPIWGDFDYDGDGRAEEMNLGCESCHGPGSAHWESTGQGRHIVSPSLLTPEREAMICGQCHSRPKGALKTDSPVDADGWMMVAGTSREDFLANYAKTQLDGATTDFYADDAKHSKSHHQQYSDFIRSPMYKNGTQLMTCSSCHDPHRRDNVRQLRADPTDNAALCGGACHDTQAGDLKGHIDLKLGGTGGMMSSAKCTDCHMPKTAKTGAGHPGLSVGGTQFWQNDVSSHIFDVPDKSWSATTGQAMPTGYTNTCANSACHSGL